MRDQVPMLRMGNDLLITLQGDLDDATVEHIEQVVTQEVARANATGALIDISGLAVVDSFVARVLARLVAMIRLLGAEATVVGIQPAVAITLVELGVPMGHVRTALNAEQGLAQLRGVRDEPTRR
jgi:rsbT antagonist protein RsbS